ncbi:MAG: hypothetical protein AAF152_12910 [Cyanobacteria bacterium P01_A01_bin.114]
MAGTAFDASLDDGIFYDAIVLDAIGYDAKHGLKQAQLMPACSMKIASARAPSSRKAARKLAWSAL